MSSSKPFLIMQLRPEDEVADSELASICRFGGLKAPEIVRLRVEQKGIPPLRLDDFSAIIVGGSPFDITTPKAQKSAVQIRLERDFNALFDQVLAVDFPFLGACSGNGLLGGYCGATISRRFGEPVGGAEIELTPEGERDPLLAGLPKTFRALVGHKEACDATPPGAELLASGDRCPVQMFRVGRNAYATQFHPEGDADGFILRVDFYKHCGYFAPDEAGRLKTRLSREKAPFPNVFLQRFVERYRGHDRRAPSEIDG